MSAFGSALNTFLSAVGASSSSSPFLRWLLQTLALSQALIPSGWPATYTPQDGERFDFIIVGAGSAGAALAARLSEVPSWNILLIEAGGDPPPTSVIPSLFTTLAHTESDWDYVANLDKPVGKSHVNQKLFLTRGKMLGGSSSNNYLIYARGVPEDYYEWEKVAPGWNWQNVLHYFKKLENMEDPVIMNSKNAFLHSTNGPVKITRPKPNKYFQQLNELLLKSFEELGLPQRLENNGPETTGVSLPHFFLADGRRSSTAEAYLIPAADRPNLFVTKYANVNKVLIGSKKQAYGVEVLLRSGKIIEVYSDKEIILSAGAVNSPKILMLSGIGPTEELEKFNIEVIKDLPVGKNLQDHAVVPIVFSGLQGISSAIQNVYMTSELDAFPVPLQTGFFNLNHTIFGYDLGIRPSFQFFHMHAGAGISLPVYIGCRAIANFDQDFCISLAESSTMKDLDLTALVLLNPKSRGVVTLRSRNPIDDPVINLGYFRRKEDLEDFTHGVKYMARLVNTSYFRSSDAEVLQLNIKECRNFIWGSDKYWRCYVRNTVGTLLHPSGTCRMSANGGVVNERLQVHGVTGLRIVDASIMPTIPSGNTNAPTIMIGERASDLIKQDYEYSLNRIL